MNKQAPVRRQRAAGLGETSQASWFLSSRGEEGRPGPSQQAPPPDPRVPAPGGGGTQHQFPPPASGPLDLHLEIQAVAPWRRERRPPGLASGRQ